MAAAAAVVIGQRAHGDSDSPRFLEPDRPGEDSDGGGEGEGGAAQEDGMQERVFALKLPQRVASQQRKFNSRTYQEAEAPRLRGRSAKKAAAFRTLQARVGGVRTAKAAIEAAKREGGDVSDALWDELWEQSRGREGGPEDRQRFHEEVTIEDREILKELAFQIKSVKERKKRFMGLGRFLLFLLLYVVVLILQQRIAPTYEIVTAQRQLLPADPFNFGGPADIYTWLNNTIINVVWQDAKCGNGLCEDPTEFPGFGPFGCAADCGLLRTVTPVHVLFSLSFASEAERNLSSWNLCLTSPASFCWFSAPQPFGLFTGNLDEAFDIPDGDWEVVINAPAGGVSGSAAVYSTGAAAAGSYNQFAGLGASVPLASWGKCKALNDSALQTCRTACARFAVCAALACNNVWQAEMAQAAMDCYIYCDSRPGLIIPAYETLNCYEVAHLMNTTNTPLSAAKDLTYCEADPKYDGRAPDVGLQGLTWGSKANGTRLIGFNTTHKPVRRLLADEDLPSPPAPPALGGGGAPRQHGAGADLAAPAAAKRDSNPAASAERGPAGGSGGRKVAPPGSGCPFLAARGGRGLGRGEVAPAAGNARQVAAPGQQDVGGRRRSVLASAAQVPAAVTPPPQLWQQLGSNDEQRLLVLEVGVSRALYTLPKEQCTAPLLNVDTIDAARFTAFLCSYMGGPVLTLPRCNYTDPRTGRQLGGFAELSDAMLYVHRNLSIAADVNDEFSDVVAGAITSAAPISADTQSTLILWLKRLAPVIVNGGVVGCNTVDYDVDWKLGATINLTLIIGDTVRFVWADDEPHSLREVANTGTSANLTGVGSGTMLLSRSTFCTRENTGYLGIDSLPPVPCALLDFQGFNDGYSTFGYSAYFTAPGTYYFEDGMFPDLIKAVIQVNQRLPGGFVSGRPLVGQSHCAPGCPIYRIRNGACKQDCNVAECAFDGGDCNCFPAASGDPSCSCPAGQVKGDAECCESENVGMGLTFPFRLRKFGADANVTDSFLLRAPGYIDINRGITLRDQLLIGMLVHQTRGDAVPCGDTRYAGEYGDCLSHAPSTAPYGVDPLFLYSSSLYNPLLNASEYYRPQELRPQGVPYGFFSTPTKGLGSGFPIIFDLNLEHQEAVSRLQYLSDGFYIDNSTKTLLVQVITYFGEHSMFGNTEVKVQFQDGGKIAISSAIYAFSVELYRTGTDIVRAVLEALVLLWVLLDAAQFYRDARKQAQRKKELFAIFESNWAIVNVLSIAVLLACSILWVVHAATTAASFDIEPRYDAYRDTYATARYWDVNPPGFARAVKGFVDLHGISRFKSLYDFLSCVSLLLLMLRFLQHCHFHPRLGIVTASLGDALPELLHFFILLGIIFVTYAFLANLVFGPVLSEYRTISASLITNFRIILRNTAASYDLLTLTGPRLYLGMLFYWTFVTFVLFILYNFLIALAIDSFGRAKEHAGVVEGVTTELHRYIRSWGRSKRYHEHVSDTALKDNIKRWAQVTKMRELEGLSREDEERLERQMMLTLANEYDATEAELRDGTVPVERVAAALHNAERRPDARSPEERRRQARRRRWWGGAEGSLRRPPLDAAKVTEVLSRLFAVSMRKILHFEEVEAARRLDENALELKTLIVKVQKKMAAFDKRLDFVDGYFGSGKGRKSGRTAAGLRERLRQHRQLSAALSPRGPQAAGSPTGHKHPHLRQVGAAAVLLAELRHHPDGGSGGGGSSRAPALPLVGEGASGRS